MSKTLQMRGYTSAEIAGMTGADRELFIDTDKETVVVQDGVTAGGHPLQKELESGVNIKTINGAPILGSGDIVIESSPSVSLKTIGGQTIEGSGDISVKTVGGQAVLGSGDIALKTVGGQTIVGSGDIGLKTIGNQAILGSGNIAVKTINGTPILGSGDIVISGGGGGGGSAGNSSDPFSELYVDGDVHVGNNITLKQKERTVATVTGTTFVPSETSPFVIDETSAQSMGFRSMWFGAPWSGDNPENHFDFGSATEARDFYNNVLGGGTTFDNLTINFVNGDGSTWESPWVVNIKNISLQENASSIYFSLNQGSGIISGPSWVPNYWSTYQLSSMMAMGQTRIGSIGGSSVTAPQYGIVTDVSAITFDPSDVITVAGQVVPTTSFTSATVAENSYVKSTPWTKPDASAFTAPQNAVVYFGFESVDTSDSSNTDNIGTNYGLHVGNQFFNSGSYTLQNLTTVNSYPSGSYIVPMNLANLDSGVSQIGKSFSTRKNLDSIGMQSARSWITWSDPQMNLGTSQFTIEMWIKANPNSMTNYNYVFSSSTDGSSLAIGINNSSKKISVEANSSTSFAGEKVVADNTWHHIALVNDGTDWNLFVDGVLDSTGSGFGQYSVNLTDAEIGGGRSGSGDGWDNRYFGSIDRFAITLSSKYQANTAFTPYDGSTAIVADDVIAKISAISDLKFENYSGDANKKVRYNAATNDLAFDGASVVNSTIKKSVIGHPDDNAQRAAGYFTYLYSSNEVVGNNINGQSVNSSGNVNADNQIVSNANREATTQSDGAIVASQGGVFAKKDIRSKASLVGEQGLNVLNGAIIAGAGVVPLDSFATYEWRFANKAWKFPSSSELDFGTNDFTIEFWIKGLASDQPTYSTVMDAAGNNAGTGIGIGPSYGVSGKPAFRCSPGRVINSSVSVLDGSWHHVAFVRQAANGFIFVDGIQTANTSDWASASGTLSGGQVGGSSYGSGESGDNCFNGSLSNLRILKGVALYASDFAVPTAELTSISGTAALILQDSTILDNGPNAFSMTVVRGEPTSYELNLGSSASGLATTGLLGDSMGNVRTTPIKDKSSVYTVAISDTGAVISATSDVVLPQGMPSGTCVKVFNNSGSDIGLIQESGLTLYVAGTSTTGDRTLAQHGIATITYITKTTAVIAGHGLN